MRKKYLFIALFIGLLSSCNKKSDINKETVRPVKIGTVESRSEIRKEFSGIVEAVNFAKLAFRVSGQIIDIPIIEGQRVKKGQLIAEIDTRDLALQYAADKAAYETATAQLERNKRLLSKQAISVQDYEISQSNYQKAKSAYELSSNNMRDSRLLAPFAGSIEKKLAENYQRTSSGMAVVQLVNTDKLRIKFTIPDSYLYLLRADSMTFNVEFDTFKGQKFKAELEEFLDVSTDGTGIPVTIIVNDPAFKRDVYDVKPGFTCNIRMKADMGNFFPSNMTVVPLSAIFQLPGSKQTSVWILNSNKVERRDVEVYSPVGNSQVFVSKGLEPGEKIVTAGVYQLTDNETVKPINN